jgi:hypothetical protein
VLHIQKVVVPLAQQTNTPTMTIAQKIKSNPYLKVSNLSDESDCIAAIQDLRDLRAIHPESEVLRNLYFKIEYKRQKFAGKIN